jgi:His/Glu/Gln/Arg/opine family amino acid ABC transporter permease subunit
MTYLPEIQQAVILTLELFFIAMGAGTGIGVLVGLGRTSSLPVISLLALAYSWFWRALPLLFILYFGFYGLPLLGVIYSPFSTAAVLLSLSSGAYIGEIVRAGLASVPRTQWEAAAALGMPRLPTLLHIILPQVIRVSIGPYISQSTLVLKGTSLAALVGVQELTGTIYSLIDLTYTVWPFLLTSAALYLVMNGMLTLVQLLVEQWWKAHF